ncbi:MAG TPA: C1 family peptidase [Thermomicrobiales bacterium]|nr:C1 family peptidase [Thermomicrobiales bacterium]
MIDLRGRYGPAKHQGPRNTCVAFAVTSSHEVLRSEGEELSVEYLHWAAARGASGGGVTLAAAAGALAAHGQPPEIFWPYAGTRDERDTAYRPSEDARKAARQRCWPAGGAITPTVASVRDVLNTGRTVILGVLLFPTWHAAATDGRIASPPPDAQPIGRHAVLVVGYGADSGGEGYLIVRNTWGSGWGDGGYGYLADRYIEQHGLRAWVLG